MTAETKVTMSHGLTKDKAFWDKIAPKYARDPIADEEAYEFTLSRTVSYLTPEMRLLELGCGTGSTALKLAPHLREVIGTDISEGMIDIARAKAQPQGKARFEAWGLREALARAEGVDVIAGFNLFHLVDDLEARLGEIYAALPEGGLFISKTPCLKEMSPAPKRWAIRAAIPLMTLLGKAPSTVRYMSAATLERMIEAKGFEIIEALSAPAISRYIVARKA